MAPTTESSSSEASTFLTKANDSMSIQPSESYSRKQQPITQIFCWWWWYSFYIPFNIMYIILRWLECKNERPCAKTCHTAASSIKIYLQRDSNPGPCEKTWAQTTRPTQCFWMKKVPYLELWQHYALVLRRQTIYSLGLTCQIRIKDRFSLTWLSIYLVIRTDILLAD